MKQVVVLVGSPRKGGNTEILANAFADGVRESGNSVELISVFGKQIFGCIGCNRCRQNEGHSCIYQDDMTAIYETLSHADVIVAATPIYFYGVSSQLKALIDRLHNPIRSTFCVKKLGLLAVCADETDAVFDSVKRMYQSILDYFSLEDGGMVLVHGIEAKSAIAGHSHLESAKEMGRNI